MPACICGGFELVFVALGAAAFWVLRKLGVIPKKKRAEAKP